LFYLQRNKMVPADFARLRGGILYATHPHSTLILIKQMSARDGVEEMGLTSSMAIAQPAVGFSIANSNCCFGAVGDRSHS
jgi:hypothetical protein